MSDPRFLIIGGGTMAGAITDGALRAGFAPARFLVAEPDASRRAAFTAKGITTVPHARDLAAHRGPGDQILIAVKPQTLAEVCAELAPAHPSGIVISILAGTPTARIRTALGQSTRIIRAMPNMPARIGQGCTALAVGSGAALADAAQARALFLTVGTVVDLAEDLFDAFTALAGSGPAYLFFLAEAMTRAGIDAGIPADIADRATRQTLLGAAALLAHSPDLPGALRTAVTSRGGTTEAALRVLETTGAADAIVRAILAARDRGRELAS